MAEFNSGVNHGSSREIVAFNWQYRALQCHLYHDVFKILDELFPQTMKSYGFHEAQWHHLVSYNLISKGV
jgi:hypothetical protein